MGHYVDQVATYAWMMGVNFAQLAVLYMMGDYGANREPQFVVYDLEFTDAELERWGRIILGRAEKLNTALETGVPPPLRDHLSWACKYCEFYKKVCPGGPGGWGTNFVEGT